MLRCEARDGSVRLAFKGHVVLNHAPGRPALEIGTGEGNLRMNPRQAGNYAPTEENVHLVALETARVRETKEDRVVVEFTRPGGEFTVRLTGTVVDDRLELAVTDALGTPPARSPELRALNRFRLHVPATPDEHVYGCGEQYTYLDLRGRVVPLLSTEIGFGRSRRTLVGLFAQLLRGAAGHWYSTYYPQPSFVSSRNYFVLVESYAYAEFDFTGKHAHALYCWAVPARVVVGVEATAPATIGALSRYLGRQPPLPDWAISGLWLGVGGGLGPERHHVPAKIQRARAAGIPVCAVWSQDWCGLYLPDPREQRVFWNWEVDADRYPALAEYVETLRAEGIRFTGYNNPFLMTHGPMYAEAARAGYLIETPAGTPYPLPAGGWKVIEVGYLDLTNPACWMWTKNWIRDNMIAVGLAGWMADYGEYLPPDARLHSGQDATRVHNQYPVLWAQVNYEACREAGKLDPGAGAGAEMGAGAEAEAGADTVVFFTRAGHLGTSRYSPLVWAGDQMANWSRHHGLPTVILAGLSLGFSGIGHYHADIGGLFTPPSVTRTKELWMRWTEFACFTPVMRTHEGHDYEGGKNWTYDSDAETLAHLAKFTRVHRHLRPYVRHLLDEYQATGLPLMRHPYVHHETADALHAYPYQYLYGRDLLVAPVVKKKKRKWKVCLPPGRWVHAWTGGTCGAPGETRVLKVAAPLGQPPVFYRPESPFVDLFAGLREIS